MKPVLIIAIAATGILGLIVGITQINELDEFSIDEPEFLYDENLDCLGTAQCFEGEVNKIIDGNSILVGDQSVRFSLSSAPQLKGFGGVDARDFLETLCPVGSTVTVDEDDGQIIGVYGRLVGLVYCDEIILNQEILDANIAYLEKRFCDSSEFANTTWAIKHGCE
ncbi:MAG: thermonuclease family protein [Thaumarchaeota archaeon]|jgi:endonuclease YncB( thermonuclease family)|nr:thermonuclease family protein [Nitrososphaerota archaeon]MBT5843115.1 thermonuclease family protein [Nitrososphaerota archaeon]MBT6468504.1 thermonuclease family protein [Nitrososphaerota archaeon]